MGANTAAGTKIAASAARRLTSLTAPRAAAPYAASRCSHCTSFLGTEGGPLHPDAALTPGAPVPGASAS